MSFFTFRSYGDSVASYYYLYKDFLKSGLKNNIHFK